MGKNLFPFRRVLAVTGVTALALGAVAVPAFAAQPGGDQQLSTGSTASPFAYPLQGDVLNPTGASFTAFNTNLNGGQATFCSWCFASNSTTAGDVVVRGIAFNNANGIGLLGVLGPGDPAPGASNAAGVLGIVTSATSHPGVLGWVDANPAAGFQAAVKGTNDSTSGNGIGVTGTQAGSGWGVYGYTPSGTGVLGSTGTGTGGYFTTSGAGGYGVFGYNSSTNTSADGIYGRADGGNGVYGYSPSGFGIYGFSNSGVGLNGASGSGTGFYGYSLSSNGGVLASQNAIGVRALTYNSGSYAIVTGGLASTYGNVLVNGRVTATGGCCTTPQTDQGRREMYASESTQNIYTDQGSARLVNGKAIVTIDPLYAQTVSLSAGYQVFVTANSADTLGLAVVNKTATSFEVRELGKGTGNFSFDWRVDGLRKGYEKSRMEPAQALPSNDGVPSPPKSLAPHPAPAMSPSQNPAMMSLSAPNSSNPAVQDAQK